MNYYECDELGYCPHMQAGFVNCRQHCGLGCDDEDEDEIEVDDRVHAWLLGDDLFAAHDKEYREHLTQLQRNVNEEDRY